MLNDARIIVILIGQFSALLILALSVYFAAPVLRRWNINSGSAGQIELERKTFFVSTALQYILVFQIVLFFLFLIVVNTYLPNLITGAMCATGILALNPYGYPALYIKLVALIIYFVFIFLNRLDFSEPGYPLTPTKYYILPLIVIFMPVDTYLTIKFFIGIKPEVIATCCSISFSNVNSTLIAEEVREIPINIVIGLYYTLFFVFAVLSWRKTKKTRILLIIEFFLSLFSLLALKYHFVKYIYALPSHNCLFDLFFHQYHYIGYILFISLFFPLITSLCLNLLFYLQKYFITDLQTLKNKMYLIGFCGNLIFAVIIHIYWVYWKLIIK